MVGGDVAVEVMAGLVHLQGNGSDRGRAHGGDDGQARESEKIE